MTQSSSSDFSATGDTGAGTSGNRSRKGGGGATSGGAQRDAGTSGAQRDVGPASVASKSQKLLGVGQRLVGTWFDSRRSALTQTFSSTADGLRRLGDTYGDQGNIKSYIDAAADGLDTVSEELNNQNLDDLGRHAATISRNYPVTVFAGALAAGLVVSRVLRSAAEAASSSDTAQGRSHNGPSKRTGAGSRHGRSSGRSET